MRILVVEDEAMIALQMEIVLKQAGHDVVAVADDVEPAVDDAQAKRPELALVDIQLGEHASGLHVAAALKNIGVPSLFVTGNCLGRDRGDIALGCLHKPFTSIQVLAAIQAAQDLLEGRTPEVRVSTLHLYSAGDPVSS